MRRRLRRLDVESGFKDEAVDEDGDSLSDEEEEEEGLDMDVGVMDAAEGHVG